MNDKIDLKEMERKIYLSFTEDGLWDISGGLVILNFGLLSLTHNEAVLPVMAALWTSAIIARKKIIAPRLGNVKFLPPRAQRSRLGYYLLMGILTLSALMGGVFFTLFNTNPDAVTAFMEVGFMPSIGVLLTISLILAGWYTGVKRLYAYAGLAFLTYLVGIASGMDRGIYVSFLGAAIIGTGIVYLVQFLRKYPLRKHAEFEQEWNGEQIV